MKKHVNHRFTSSLIRLILFLAAATLCVFFQNWDTCLQRIKPFMSSL